MQISQWVNYRETRTGNTLYQELSFQDSEAIGEVDEGADISGKRLKPFLSPCRYFIDMSQKHCVIDTMNVPSPVQTK